jgi:hypothetical protein
MLTYPSQHAHFDLAPADLALWGASIGSKRYHDTISPQGQRQGRHLGRQRLGRGLVAPGDGGQFPVEMLQGLMASRLHPPPHGTRAHHPTTIPPQQPGRGRKRPKDREGTAQTLEFPAGPLMRLHPKGLIQRGHLWDGAALRAAADPALPPDRAQHTRELARRKALTPPGRPTRRAGRPGGGLAGALVENSFDSLDCQDTGDLPRRQDQCREGASVFQHA